MKLQPKQQNLLEFGLVAVALLLILFQFYQLYTGVYDVDFPAFERAIKNLLAGKTPYQLPSVEQAQEAWELSNQQSFHYPLWSSFLYLPIAWLKHSVALQVWLVLNLIALAPLTWLLQRLYLPALKQIYIIPLYCISLSISTLNLLDGFPNILIGLGLALMLYTWKTHRPFQSGIWGGLAMAIKPQLTFMIGLSYLLRLLVINPRQRRFAGRWWGGVISAGVALLLVSLLLQPDWIGKLISVLREESLTGGVDANGNEIVWVTSTFPAWFNYLSGLEGSVVDFAYGVFVLVLGGLGIYRLVGWRLSPLAWLSLAVTLNLTLTPYTRPYDYALMVFPIFALLTVVWAAYRQQQFLVAIFYSAGIVLIYLMPVLNKDFRWFFFQPLLATLLLLTISPARGYFFTDTEEKEELTKSRSNPGQSSEQEAGKEKLAAN